LKLEAADALKADKTEEEAVAERTTALEADMAQAKADIDGVEELAAANKTATETNAADIDKLEASLAEGGVTFTSIAAAQAKADQAQNEVDALEQAHATDKAALEAKDAEIAGNVTAVSDRVTALEEIQHVEISESQINALFETA